MSTLWGFLDYRPFAKQGRGSIQNNKINVNSTTQLQSMASRVQSGPLDSYSKISRPPPFSTRHARKKVDRASGGEGRPTNRQQHGSGSRDYTPSIQRYFAVDKSYQVSDFVREQTLFDSATTVAVCCLKQSLAALEILRNISSGSHDYCVRLPRSPASHRGLV